MLMEMTVQEFLSELASDSPAPGGGSVSALAGGLAAALLSMVANLTTDTREAERVLTEAGELRGSLEADVDADTAAFNRVMDAFRLPKGSDQDKEVRSQAIQQALQGAATHPLKVAQRCLQVLELCRWAVKSGNPNALSDAGVASLLAFSGIKGALYNVDINLQSIKDPEFKGEMVRKRDEILARAYKIQEELEEQLKKQLQK